MRAASASGRRASGDRGASGLPRNHAKPRARIPIERALTDPKLLGAALGDLASWRAWISVVKAAYGRPLTASECRAFSVVSGGRAPPTRKVRELVVKASRRAGKGRIAGALAAYEGALVDHSAHLVPGEVGVVAVISPTREQARIVQRYALGYFEASPVLRDEVAEVTADEIRLTNGIVICTLASDYRTLRGRTLLLAILDEAAFLRDETSSTPDIEAARALLPGLMTTGGMLAIMSSPYRRTGLLHQRHRDFFGKDDDDVLVVSGESLQFNPTLDESLIEAARLSDPQAAAAEWFGEYRSDLAQFLDDALIDGAIDASRPVEIPPRSHLHYVAFADASGGRHDASALCIGHVEGEGDAVRYVADVVRGFRSPHDPALAVKDFAALAREYRVTEIFGDNYSAEWVSGAFADAGITYRRSELNRSALYLEGLPLFVRGLVSIPDHPILTRELRLLERRTTRAGRDSVDHGTSGSDDHANALFGMLHRLSAGSPADQWIRWSAKEAERASEIPDEAEDDQHSTRQTPFYLRGNPRQGTSAPPPTDAEQQPNKDNAPKHLWQPIASIGNSFSDAYFGALSKAEGRSLSLQTPKCSSCGRETIGSRLTDGVRAFCDAGCQQRYATAMAERNRARAIAENNGLPPTSQPVKQTNEVRQ